MGSDREPEATRYSAMRWNTPLSEAHADALIESLEVGAAASVLDLGCGWAELLIRVVQPLAIFGQDALPLAEVVEYALGAGWRVLTLSTADQREWDDFEASWRRRSEQWLFGNPHNPRAREARDHLDARLREYVNDYRGVLGFCDMVLTR